MEVNIIKLLAQMYMGDQSNRSAPRLGISGELYYSLLSGNSKYADLVNKTFSVEGSIALELYKWDTHTNIKRSLEKIELETVNILSKLKSANSLYDEYESIKASD